jgi:hypothetical protein
LEISDLTSPQSGFSFITHTPDEREMLVSKWTSLVRNTLPGIAERCGWPISQDHCFVRVCLDTALGAPWHRLVKRPAILHLTDAQLSTAIADAEALARFPESLDARNRQSVIWRRSTGGA